MTKRVSFHTLGCKLNQAETSVLRTRFLDQGFLEVPYGTQADLLVINSCSVTNTADAECRQVIRRGLKGAPGAAVAVTGCYAQLKPEEIASIDGVRGVFGSAEKMDIIQYAHEIQHWASPRIYVSELQKEQPRFIGARTTLNAERSRAFLKLQDGCDYNCTFCTIPIARGRGRAMQLDDIAKEMTSLAELGYHEVVLTGINLGEYSHTASSSVTSKFIDVVRLIESINPPFRVRISSIEPNTLSRELLDILAQSHVFVPHLHVPLQSGSNQILRSMKRRYNTEKYRSVVESIRMQMPNAGLGIDVIVGFPGESDKLFDESISFIESLPFTYLHVFTYSERDNTPAATYANQVPMSVRKNRTNRLRDLSARRQHEFSMSNIGAVFTVVSDTYNPNTQELTGITENNIRVRFNGTAEHHRKACSVLLTGCSNGHVIGKLVETVP